MGAVALIQILIRQCAYTLNAVFGRVDIESREACWAQNYKILLGMSTMKKKTHREAVVRKLIVPGAALSLLFGLPFAFANRSFANPTPEFVYVANGGDDTVS